MMPERAPGGGSRLDWRKFWTEHSNCGGTWTYVNDPANPRVICSCGLERAQDRGRD